jgi:uncharacterized protein Yka (UPF0111/DUF47 family)
MEKTQAVASMGQRAMLLPAWIKAALSANDRLKLYLTVLQAAAVHVEQPDSEAPDLRSEMAAAGVHVDWLRELPSAASRLDGVLVIPQLPQLTQKLAEELGTMARPLFEAGEADACLRERVRYWIDWLGTLHGDHLAWESLHRLTRGQRTRDDADGGDSLHLLVMDLHRQLNRQAAALAGEQIDGAHVWQLNDADRARVAAFMRGLNRTAPLKFDHPGLDAAATRDGTRLLLQNDIGTNDAHVLVMQIDEERTITLSYSDLHRSRFEFMQSLLAPLGAQWSAPQSRIDAALNDGNAFTFGSARFACSSDEVLDATLEGIGARIVFLIDWNRARKRLLPFVGKAQAIEALVEAARLEVGHMGWLKAGGEQLIHGAMQAAGDGAFQIGDRLDDVLGGTEARDFLVEVMRLATQALRGGQPLALIADETRLLLARCVRQHRSEFELLEEHAAYCHALAQAVSDALAHEHAPELAARAKVWERQADHLVMRAREQAQRQPRRQPFVRLMELSDDVADALEEAGFLINLIADDHREAWQADVRQVLSRLAQAVLQAMQEHVKALAIARGLGSGAETGDSDDFLASTWSVLRSERQCDELLRTARRTILRTVSDAAAMMLANDVAIALEMASDRLLVVAYALRDMAFDQAGARQ